jgi:hypothetical protein
MKPENPEDAVNKFLKSQLEEDAAIPQHPGWSRPKRDKIKEWLLYQILLELRSLGSNVARLASKS